MGNKSKENIRTLQMKDIEIYLILPSERPTGPIKGAYALANNLIKIANVSIIFLKKGRAINDLLDPKIKKIYLEDFHYNYLKKILYVRKIIKNSNNKKGISISFCFSADMFNIFCKDLIKIVSITL